MDKQTFGALTKMLAAGMSRRLMVRGLVAGVAGGLLAGGSAAARPVESGRRRKPAKRTKPTQAMVAVCHLNEEGTYDYLRLPEQALKGHAKHAGDAIGVDLATDRANCGACGNICPPGDACTAVTCVEGQCAVTNLEGPCGDDGTGICVDGACEFPTAGDPAAA